LEWRYPDAKAALRKVRNEDEHIDLLHQKLIEEAGELMYAISRDDLAEEAGDLVEVIYALCRIRGVTLTTLETRRIQKLRTHGGFGGGVVWDLT
jgi:predicted house-cleaning noncanonical NTP pyrophosphatase (MazG superfamily)